MIWSVVACCIWVVLATVTAFLPMRLQYVPGLTLLVLAPVLIGWLGYDLGWFWAVLALAGFGSMFRNPLKYLWARARGQSPQVPR